MNKQIQDIAVKLSEETITSLDTIGTCYTRRTFQYGRIRGHYIKEDKEIIGAYTFFSKGKEIWRSYDRNETIVWLAKQYFNLI